MALFDELVGRADVLDHARPGHQHAQPAPAKGRDGHVFCDAGEAGALAAVLFQKPHLVQLLEHYRLHLHAVRVRRVEVGEEVGELAEASAEGVVLGVVERVGEVVALAHGGFAMRTVGLVGDQVDFAEEALLVVFEFADHDGSPRGEMALKVFFFKTGGDGEDLLIVEKFSEENKIVLLKVTCARGRVVHDDPNGVRGQENNFDAERDGRKGKVSRSEMFWV